MKFRPNLYSGEIEMKRLVIAFAFFMAAVQIGYAQAPTVTVDDLKILEGPKWTGTLTYLDYRSNKKTSIKSNLIVTRASDNASSWQFAYEYPDEPKANDSSTVDLTELGRRLGGKEIIEKETTSGGGMRLVATMDGTDNNKKALFRFTYLISRNAFSIKKEVRLDGATEWFERNTYSWTR
jgi:hypothetical protein